MVSSFYSQKTTEGNVLLSSGFIVVAILMRFISNAGYLVATWRGRVHPSLVSWFFWGLTAFIAFAVQVHKGSGMEALVILAGGFGAWAIVAAAIYRGSRKIVFSTSDKWCAALTVIGIAMWITTSNPLTALFMSIFADFTSSIPTVIKSYRAPHTEHPLPYLLTASSMALTLLVTKEWDIANWAFPAYILAIDLTIAILVMLPMSLRSQKLLLIPVPVRATVAPRKPRKR